jgi:hypothetical protein
LLIAFIISEESLDPYISVEWVLNNKDLDNIGYVKMVG